MQPSLFNQTDVTVYECALKGYLLFS